MGPSEKDNTYFICPTLNKVSKVLSSFTGATDKTHTHTFIQRTRLQKDKDKRRHCTQQSEYTFIVATHIHKGFVHYIVELAF